MSEVKISEAGIVASAEVLHCAESASSMDQARDLATLVIQAALPHIHPQPVELSFDVEAMLAACLPGGSIVDPQVVADNIRAWAAERKPAELAEQQGVGNG